MARRPRRERVVLGAPARSAASRGRIAGYEGTSELAIKPTEPWRFADVGLASPALRRLIDVECWNTIGDIGAPVRSSHRKRSELEGLAVGRLGTRAAVGLVWVVRATGRNRTLVARYPQVLNRAFPASSRAWVAVLTTGAAPPEAAGLVWVDPGATRLFAWSRRAVA